MNKDSTISYRPELAEPFVYFALTTFSDYWGTIISPLKPHRYRPSTTSVHIFPDFALFSRNI